MNWIRIKNSNLIHVSFVILAIITLFFGDSFTFRVEVNDNETMPYQVGIKSHGKYRINPYSAHLNALVHQIIAKYIVYNILENSSSRILFNRP